METFLQNCDLSRTLKNLSLHTSYTKGKINLELVKKPQNDDIITVGKVIKKNKKKKEWSENSELRQTNK